MTRTNEPKRLNLPILKSDGNGKPVYVRIASPIYTKDMREWLNVTSLETGEEQRIAVRTMLGNELRRNYANDGYVGKDFEIKEFKPQDGKDYYTCAIIQVELTDVREQKLNLQIESGKQKKVPNVATRQADKDKLLVQSFRDDYPKYLRSRRWKKIRDRIWAQDGKLCRRCGGQATEVHHRSYSDEVMLGRDDDRLASICEGCHRVIHFDGSGKKREREDEEIDRLLLERNESTDFPPPVIDLRKTRCEEHPVEWNRMSAVQRVAWSRECQRLWIIAKLRRQGDSRVTDLNRKWLYGYGMDDKAIDLAIAEGSRSRATRKKKRGDDGTGSSLSI